MPHGTCTYHPCYIGLALAEKPATTTAVLCKPASSFCSPMPVGVLARLERTAMVRWGDGPIARWGATDSVSAERLDGGKYGRDDVRMGPSGLNQSYFCSATSALFRNAFTFVNLCFCPSLLCPCPYLESTKLVPKIYLQLKC